MITRQRKCSNLRLYVQTESASRRSLAWSCSGITLNKNKRDTPLLYHVSKGNNAWPGGRPPPSQESPDRPPSMSESRLLPPQVIYDGPYVSSSWPVVAQTRPPALWRGILFCCSAPRLDHVLRSCGACVIFVARKAYVWGERKSEKRSGREQPVTRHWLRENKPHMAIT